MALLLPPRVQREIQKDKWREQRAERQAAIMRMVDFDDPVCREWQPVLVKLDPSLRLGRARPQAYEPGVNVRPGFYHWVRLNETASPTVQPITGPDGESFAEPDSALLERLKGNDLQDPRVFAAMIAQHEEHERAVEADRAALRARMDSEVLDRYRAATRTQVLLSPDVSWTQNAAGRKSK